MAVNGDEVDQKVIRLACDIAKKSKAKIYAVHVIKVKRSLPLDAEMEVDAREGTQTLDRAERMAADEGYEIEPSLLQAREVGPALVEEAIELKADLVVIGITYRKRFGEFSLGDTVNYVLKNVPCEVLLYREPAYSADEASEPSEAEEVDK